MRPFGFEGPGDLNADSSGQASLSLNVDDGANTAFPEAIESEEEAEPVVVNVDDEFFGEKEEEPLFSPPLYIQRYCAVERIIDLFAQKFSVKSLLDLGCAELKFLVRAKNGKKFQRIVGVDRDEFLVGSHSRRIEPGVFEMINKRDEPLTMEVYAGDATEPDQRLIDIDVVTAIELIEHMEPETHSALTSTIFGVTQPQLAIFTTPNVEYNPLFPSGSVNIRRHWDHRFEWTRAEFQAWANSVTEKYSAYSVEFDGVGSGPTNTLETHGFCSQIAIFVRNSNFPKEKRHVTGMPFKLIREVEFPWAPPKTLAEEISSIIDGECYTLAKEMQEEEEKNGIFNREIFFFTLENLVKNRWRLQNLLENSPDFEIVRVVLRDLDKNWMKFDEEKDEISYKLLLQPESDDCDDSFGEDQNGDVEAEVVGFYPMDAETELMLEQMEDSS